SGGGARDFDDHGASTLCRRIERTANPAETTMPEPVNELESALAAMSPMPSRLDRDALMYAAGRAAAPRRGLWPLLAGGFAVVAVGLAIHDLTLQPPVIEKNVTVREPARESPAPEGSRADTVASDRSSYRELERQVLKRGDVPLIYP